ncbi:ATP-binding protein [Pseudoalteromonas sp. NJ631]|uniref:ATP-binding protein n=1 Tax=Pseudoalteromonas sp. NJ631 TaxID=493915 RepID=UPI000311B588|nr:ATP-binding protein [Pseudoalteromonas sp. NJ631]
MWQSNFEPLAQTPSKAALNAKDVEQECDWLQRAIQYRVSHYFGQSLDNTEQEFPLPPTLDNSDSQFADFITRSKPNLIERLLIILAFVPVIKAPVLDIFLSINEQTNRPFSEFGIQESQGQIFTTGITAAFILNGNNLNTEFDVLQTLHSSQLLNLMVDSHREPEGISRLNVPLVLKPEFIQMFTTAEPYRPETSHQFPATQVNTTLEWDDVKLPDTTRHQLNEIITWVQYGKTLQTQWKIGKQLRPGYRALFYGPPGTGKTLTASVLGKILDKSVYKVDLSLITSKYIGETEKNLEQLFSLAEHRDWILFFDEADALFTKRLKTSSSNDQFANQNVAYLLQRIESFSGVVILASNYKDNIDDAFFRRFESIVQFQAPKAAQRLEIWQSGLCHQSSLSSSVCLNRLAEQYPLSGADIINVLRFVSLRLLSEARTEITITDIREGISRLSNHQTPLRW